VDFDGSGSSDPDGDSIVSYTFNFGDGSAELTQEDSDATHVYKRPAPTRRR